MSTLGGNLRGTESISINSNVSQTVPLGIGMVGGTYATDTNYLLTTPQGMTFKIETKNMINPKLYFSYVKSKFTITEQEALRKNLTKLKKLIVLSKEMQQQAYYESLCLELAKTVREQEAQALGYDRKLDVSMINKFRYQVKDDCIKFETLEKFPRVIPKRVRAVIKKLQGYKLFDELHVLYIDYTGEVVKTNKDKIREKDPILFGKFSFAPNTYYYITDWVDKYCDLTLVKLVDTLKTNDPEFGLDSIPEIDDNYVKQIMQEVDERIKRLNITTPSNYRNLMVEEDKVNNPRMVVKAGFFKKLWNKIRRE